MEIIRRIKNKDDILKIMNIALEHEWAVSLEYLFHAYSMPKGKFFYMDPIMKETMDVRAQTIQIGIDEMYHAVQLGIIIKQMGGDPSMKVDEVRRYPKILDNLKRDKKTEDLVTDLYQGAEFSVGDFPKEQNMFWNISYDEVRHAAQFTAMMEAMKEQGAEDALMIRPDPAAEDKEEVRLLHRIMRLENELMHRYLRYVLLFSEHQDLTQRLFKNSINHMRHWDKNAGLLKMLGSVIAIENAEMNAEGIEISRQSMPDFYPGKDRVSAMETLVPAEEELLGLYEKMTALLPDEEIKAQLKLHMMHKREHLFTQEWLLKNARRFIV
jgi:bacterioferritin (cytochrome b1)